MNKTQLEILEQLGHTKQDVDGNYTHPQLIGWQEIESFANQLLLKVVDTINTTNKHQAHTTFDLMLVDATQQKIVARVKELL